ncbi:hypothetical protein L596_017370 [Steinernema carpocapsae]|uniref:Origin recognition complex subunit 3 N-terminal domain-containing protein n=1 Tax=Steinernema carpocapsae TaxID=34508 RepID=A0A4U5N1G7_STECR|nr:hypothetical protein L596_017370 [Steinernema carpocapsae]
MDFKRGKKKTLSLEKAFGDKQKAQEFREILDQVEGKVSTTFEILYSDVLREIFDFVGSFNGASIKVPSAVLTSGYVDGRRLFEMATQQYGANNMFHHISPRAGTHAVHNSVLESVELLNQLFNKNYHSFDDVASDPITKNPNLTKKVVIWFERAESISATFMKTFVETLTERKLPIAFIFCASTNPNIVQGRCTRNSCAVMAFRLFKFDQSDKLLSQVLSDTFLNEEMWLELDGNILDTLCWRFNYESYTIERFLSSISVALLFHFAKPKTSKKNWAPEAQLFTTAYWKMLELLYSLTSGPNFEGSSFQAFYELHIKVQEGKLFDSERFK